MNDMKSINFCTPGRGALAGAIDSFMDMLQIQILSSHKLKTETPLL